MTNKIDKLNLHYSMTTPATIYDEEALTSLQLAGRIAGKLNQVIELVNLYGEKVDNTYVKIQKITEDEVKMTLTTGLFDRVLEEYHRKLDAKINSIVASAGDGSIPSELALIRNTYDGQSYELASQAINNQFKVFSENPLPDEMLYTLFDKTPNLFNPRNVSYNLALSDSEAILGNPSEYYHTTGYIDLYPLPGTITDKTSIWFKQSMDGETVSMAQVRAVNFYDENYNHITTPSGRFEYLDYILVNDFPEYARYIRVTFAQEYLNAETNFGIGYTQEACLYKHYTAKIAIDPTAGWEGSNIIVFGDSQVGQNKWQGYLRDKLGVNIYNLSFAGYPVTAPVADNPEFSLASSYVHSKFVEFLENNDFVHRVSEDPVGFLGSKPVKAVLFLGGTNDMGYYASPGKYDELEDDFLGMEWTTFDFSLSQEDTFIQGVQKIGEMFKYYLGYSDVYFISPPPRIDYEHMKMHAGHFTKPLEEFCRFRGYKYINGFSSFNNTQAGRLYLEDDGVHLNSFGAKKFAGTVINALKANCEL